MSVKICVLAGAIALMAVTGFAGPAAAQQQNCTGNSGIDWDIQIGACTAAIQSGRWQGKGLAWAFNNRGIAYGKKGQTDRAIQDYDQAIKLNPNYDAAFNNRGVAYGNKGQTDRAIQDYDQAIKLNPNYAAAFKNRGYANFYFANYGAAASDLARVVTEKPDDAYPVLWLYLARARSGNQDAVTELEAHAKKLKTTEWPYAVIELYLGRRTAETTLAAASKPDERCEAQFYVGMWHLLRGDRAAAVQLLKMAANTCPKTFIEYAGAQVELKRLGQ